MSCASEFFALSSNLFAEFLASIFIRSIKSEHIIASSQFYIFRNMRKSRCTYKQTCVHLFTNFLKMLFMADLFKSDICILLVVWDTYACIACTVALCIVPYRKGIFSDF